MQTASAEIVIIRYLYKTSVFFAQPVCKTVCALLK